MRYNTLRIQFFFIISPLVPNSEGETDIFPSEDNKVSHRW
ncbi:Uncharacterized protein dnm_001130 [Desulfonema magnum]|uniref:Uncharacterized protein n=1 Tax=Desulfonema magnum TaxID=45655 RepID=A0A975GK43_9BACT|nr:Uncharacterized protein dnm_001100 [Desulfonema magnum]QTA84120.1 Uncharacterized protein dnm_001130 [Desulfonema magnum]